jgi:hypothetical protein
MLNKDKTYKREVALGMLTYFFVMQTLAIWYPEALAAADAVKIPAFTFAAGAFALDAGAKQWQKQ